MRITPRINDAQVKRLLKRLNIAEGKIKNRSVVNRQIGIQMYGLTLRNFDSQGSQFGERWAALAASTVKEKQRIGKTVPLVRTGELRSGFTYDYDAKDVKIFNGVAHAVFFEKGTKHMVARKLLPPRDTFVSTAVKIYERYVKAVVEEVNR